MSVGSEFGDIASAFGEEIYYNQTTIKNPKTMLSKVKSVQANGSFPNDYGAVQDNPDLPNHGQKLLYKFEYEFEDGTVMTANHKTTVSPFPEGSEVEYDIVKTHPEHGKSGKVKKPDSGNYTGSKASNDKPMDNTTQTMIVKQNALGHATELLKHNAMMDNDKFKSDDVIALAEKYRSWVMQPESKPEVTPQPEKVKEAVSQSTIGQPGVKQPNPANPDSVTDDLPL